MATIDTNEMKITKINSGLVYTSSLTNNTELSSTENVLVCTTTRNELPQYGDAVCTYDAKQPHEGEAGGGVVGAIVELGHLIVLPGVVSFREESRPLWVQSADRLRWGRIGKEKQCLLKQIFNCKEDKT